MAVTPARSVGRDLRAIVGREHAREATAADAVDGVPARWVVEPGSVAEAADVLRLCSGNGLAAVPRGAGTKLGWGNPPARLDVVVSTARMDALLDHASGDLVARTQAGMPLDRLQERLAGAGQMLALDPPEAAGTLGGTVAANASGPGRHRYGTARDLVIGMTVVLADGTVAKAGGSVVKNVAGYDLMKLYTGSLGTLGLIAELVFRLHPVPVASRTVVARVPGPAAAGALQQALLHSALVPSAIELSWPDPDTGPELAVRFEGIEPGVAGQAATAAGMAGEHGEAVVLAGAEERAAWARLTAVPWDVDGTGLKVAAVPAALPATLERLRGSAAAHGVALRVSGRAGAVVLLASLSGAEGDVAEVVREIRREVGAAGGSAVLVQAPPGTKRDLDAWGPAGDALDLMRRVKARFDPADAMAPGRFVGGI